MSFFCEKCEKFYKTYQSLYNHKKIYHSDIKESEKVRKKEKNENNNECEYCNKSYSTKYTLARHHETCKDRQLIVNNSIDGDHNVLIHGDNNEPHINSHNTQNIQVIVNMGDENLSELLSVKEQLKILNKRNKCLEYIIQYIHFNDKFPQFKNVMVDDLKSDVAFKFDTNKKDYIAVKKDDLLDDLIENRLSDIEEFCTNNEDDVKRVTKQRINRYISKMEKEFEDPKSIFMKEQKKNLELTMYNGKDVIKPIQKEIRKLKKKKH